MTYTNNQYPKGAILMKIIDLLKKTHLSAVYAATILYALTVSLAIVIAPSTAHAVKNTQAIHQAAKTEANSFNRFQEVRNNNSG